jgi:hypothetical protein
METMRRFSRRTFVAWVGGASAGFYLFGRLPGMSAPIALAQIPGGTLDPNDVAKFVTPMLVPPVMPRAATITQRGGKNVDYYEISMKQIVQQILPAGLPATTVQGVASGPRATGERQVSAQQALPGDPARDPGSLVQRGRVALLSRLARVLRRNHR